MIFKGAVLSGSLNSFSKQIRPEFYTDFLTLTNDVAKLSGVVNLTSADLTLDTDRRDCSFNSMFWGNNLAPLSGNYVMNVE